MEAEREAKKIWEKMAAGSLVKQTNLEPVILKKLLNIFNVGDYYYYIFNVPLFTFEFVSPEMEKILGYNISDFNIPFLIEKVHPEDISWFLDFESAALEFLKTLPIEKVLKYKIRYDYRLKKVDGNYIRILHQAITITQGDKGEVARALGVHTDITHIKKEGKPVLSFIGLEGEPSYIDVNIKKKFAPSNDFLSKREKEILGYLISGKSSMQIAMSLFISKDTVDTHRRNMIRKASCSNTGELIANAVKFGYI